MTTIHMAPDKPAALSNHSYYSEADFKADRAAFYASIDGASVNIARARILRDKMLWSCISDVNNNYYDFKTNFHSDRASVNTLVDMANLGMLGAATVEGGSAVLSAASAALTGSRLSADKNFFAEQTTTSIFVTMDALRDNQLALIQTKLINGPDLYSFDEAFNDAVKLFEAGTVISALQNISAEAGKQKIDASKNNETATKVRVFASRPAITKDAADLKPQVYAILGELDANRENNIPVLREVLTTLNVENSTDDNSTALITKLRNKMDAANTAAEFNAIQSAIEAAKAKVKPPAPAKSAATS